MTEKDPNAAVDEALGAIAKRLREADGLTLKAAAEQIRVKSGERMNFATLWELENGAYRWNTKYMVIVAQGYDQPDDYLLRAYAGRGDATGLDDAWASGSAAAVLDRLRELGVEPGELLILLGKKMVTIV